MNILYCGDKNIADGLIMSLLSLAHNVREPLSVFVMTARVNINETRCEPLEGQVIEFLDRFLKKQNPQSQIKLIDITDEFEAFVPTANLETRFTPCCMLRLYADLIPQLPKRILYLDNDVICRGEISEFYHQSLDDCELVGVPDHYGKWFFRTNPFKMDYLNSGVLLLNLKKIRESGLFQKCRQRCRDKKMFMPDQSAINKLAENKRCAPRKFNEQRRLKNDTVFHHFTTSFRFFPYFHSVTAKPWQIERVHSLLRLYEYDELYAEYMALKNDLLKGVNRDEQANNTCVFQH